jgi:hypothetical protein
MILYGQRDDVHYEGVSQFRNAKFDGRLGSSRGGGSGSWAWSVNIDAFSDISNFVYGSRKSLIWPTHSGEKSRFVIGFSIDPSIQR